MVPEYLGFLQGLSNNTLHIPLGISQVLTGLRPNSLNRSPGGSMKIFSAFLFTIFCFGNTFASIDNACYWDGEEAVKEYVLDGDNYWIDVINYYYDHGQDVKADFEGVGSCRFISSSLGDTADAAVAAFEKASFAPIIASRAYFKISGTTMKLVVASAKVNGTSVTFASDFYADDRPVCLTQRQDMINVGRASAGLDMLSLSAKKSQEGSIAVLITPTATTTDQYGICNFHPF